jgi:hypothetical protein
VGYWFISCWLLGRVAGLLVQILLVVRPCGMVAGPHMSTERAPFIIKGLEECFRTFFFHPADEACMFLPHVGSH